MKRSFTVIGVSTVHGTIKGQENLGGHFVNETPVEAARKAASKICSMSKIHGQCTLLITIRETTPGSRHKEYMYKVKRIKNIKTVMKGDKEITFQYITVAKSLQKISPTMLL